MLKILKKKQRNIKYNNNKIFWNGSWDTVKCNHADHDYANEYDDDGDDGDNDDDDIDDDVLLIIFWFFFFFFFFFFFVVMTMIHYPIRVALWNSCGFIFLCRLTHAFDSYSLILSNRF